MKTIALNDVSDDQIQSESQLLVDLIRNRYPKLDLRRGTVLRDLLIDTDAAVGSMYKAQSDEQRKSSSLLEMEALEASGEQVDKEDVDAVLSNFNMTTTETTQCLPAPSSLHPTAWCLFLPRM